jgi:HSP20 family protein
MIIYFKGFMRKEVKIIGGGLMIDIIPWERTKSLTRLRKEMDDLWGHFFGDVGFHPFRETIWAPALDIKETKDNLVVTAELPGLGPKEIEVSISGDLLTLKGEKKQEREEKEESFHLVERRYGSFSRSIRLPSEVDPQNIKAGHKDGILTITLPKSEKAKEKQIKITIE